MTTKDVFRLRRCTSKLLTMDSPCHTAWSLVRRWASIEKVSVPTRLAEP
jgi:hypothetical protein